MDNIKNKIDPSLCTGTGRVGHKSSEYGVIGFSPCGEYVAHESNKPCNVIETTIVKTSPPGPKTCQCRTDSCPCGDFISHKVYEPCTAKAI
jgi:hypothetical protein